MRALSLAGPRDPHLISVPDPSPGAEEVLVRVHACGVCGSDLNAWRGVPGIEFPMPPGAPGHEVVGSVVATGAGVALQPGEIVTGLMFNGFAQLGVAPAADLVPIPNGMPEVLGEPLACAMNVVRRSGVSSGQQRLAIVGFGYLAALIVQLLPDGIGEWVTISRREDSRALARQLGATAAYGFDNVPPDLWDSFDVVIEAAGVQQTLDYSTWLTAYGGRLVIAGYHADGPRTVNVQSWNWKGIDVINAHERRAAVNVEVLRRALDLIRVRRIDPTRFQTHAFPLERAAEAFTFAESRPGGFVKAVVCP